MEAKRFEKIYSQGKINVMQIWVDRETGVHYLLSQQGYCGGLTPLLGKDGKPVIDLAPTQSSAFLSGNYDRN